MRLIFLEEKARFRTTCRRWRSNELSASLGGAFGTARNTAR